MSLLTISSPFGSGGKEIAQIVADGLNLEIYDDRKLLELAPAAGILPEDLKDLRQPGFFDRIFTKKPQVYLDYMGSIIFEVSRQGKGVIIGHGSQMLLQDFSCALHVRIQAAEASRIEYVAQKQGLSKESACKLIHKLDSKQRGFFRLAFGKNLNDSSLYDLIINCEKLGYDSAARLIIDAANAEEIHACSLTALEVMEKLSLIKKIQAALLKDNLDDNMLTVDVSEIGVVELSGLTHSQELFDRIIDVVHKVQGVSKVHSEIVVGTSLYAGDLNRTRRS
jgi:cytidylate kinase